MDHSAKNAAFRKKNAMKFLRMMISLGVIGLLIFFTDDPTLAEEQIELDGVIEPSTIVEVSSQVPGILSEILVDRGKVIKKGDVLARLESNLERVQVDLARARVEAAKRKIQQNDELHKKQLISAYEKDKLEGELAILKLAEKEAIERLKMRTIRSTTDGIVVKLSEAPGAYVSEDDFMMIAKINPLYVEVVAPVEYIGIIREGMQATVMPEPPVGGSYNVKVALVDKIIDSSSDTFGVRLILSNPGNKLQAGLKCKVRFTWK